MNSISAICSTFHLSVHFQYCWTFRCLVDAELRIEKVEQEKLEMDSNIFSTLPLPQEADALVNTQVLKSKFKELKTLNADGTILMMQSSYDVKSIIWFGR